MSYFTTAMEFQTFFQRSVYVPFMYFALAVKRGTAVVFIICRIVLLLVKFIFEFANCQVHIAY